MRYILFAVLVFGVLIFSSCTDHVKELQCSRIDSLYNISYDFQNQLNEFSEDSIANYYATIKDFNKVLVEKLHGLPESEAMKEKLLKLGSVEKGFKKIPDKLIMYKNEVQFSLDQLEALKKDVLVGLLKDEEFESYIKDELEAIELYKPELESILKVLKKHIDNYKDIYPDIRSYVDSLANN